LVSIASDLEQVGAQIERTKASLGSLQERRRSLVLEALAAGMTEREVAKLARCAPSFVNSVAKSAVVRI
jgi:DNA-directed RNA polymerase specialized sigma24 family protein